MRRDAFLTALGAVLAAPSSVRAQTPPRMLWLQRPEVNLSVYQPLTLDDRNVYVPGYRAFCAVLRDIHVPFDEGYRAISVTTLKCLYVAQAAVTLNFGRTLPIVVHSGYRTPETNAAIEGAARNSLHMRGQAVDFHIPGLDIDTLFRVVRAIPDSGGVGLYSSWIHVDSGYKRTWNG